MKLSIKNVILIILAISFLVFISVKFEPLILLLLLICSVVLLAIFKDPRNGVCFMALTLPFQYRLTYEIGFTLKMFHVFTFLTFISLILNQILKYNTVKIKKTFLDKHLILFLLVMILSIIVNPPYNYKNIVLFLYMFFLYLVYFIFVNVGCLFKRKYLFRFLLFLIFGLVISLGYGYWGMWYGLIQNFLNLRMVGMESEANFFASYLLIILPLLFIMLVQRIKIIDLKLVFLSFVCSIIAFLLTFSRSGYISLMFCFIYCFIFFYQLKIKIRRGRGIRYLFLISLIFSIYFIFIWVLGNPLGDILEWQHTRIFTHVTIEGSGGLRARHENFISGINMFFSNPLFGVGWGNYTREFYQNLPDYLRSKELITCVSKPVFTADAANSYLEILSQVGIFGLMILLNILYNIYRNTIKVLIEVEDNLYFSLLLSFFISFLGLIVHQMTHVGIYQHYFIFIIGCILNLLYNKPSINSGVTYRN